MEKDGKEYTPMRKVLDRLGGKTSVVQETKQLLEGRGTAVSISTIYKTINEEVQRDDVAAAFLEVAERLMGQRRQLDDRARQLLTEA